MSVRSKKVTESEIGVQLTDDSTLWPEWSDTVLNKETWDSPKNGSDGLYLDTQVVQLPPSLKPYDWIRAKDLENLSGSLTVYVPDSGYLDLIANNNHLLHSEFMRWYISALINLEHCGQDGLEISGEIGDFIWNGRFQSWRGWMNVYSINKAGKGALHRPILNPNGKYVIRVYFLGSWRYIVVDDMIPVNDQGVPLLPRSSNDFELWPMLLSKALLKICSLTWNECREIIDFHPVTCLTGWVCLRLNIAYLSPQDKWDFLRKYADHFEWETEETEQEIQEGTKSKSSIEKKKSKDTMRTKKSKETDRTKKSKDTGPSKKSKGTETSKQTVKLKVLSKPQPVTLFLGLEDMREVPLEVVPGLSPCWGHFIFIEQSRDIPLDPKDVKPPLARWKLYRWLKWAISEGIIDPVEYFVPIRSLKVVSPLKQCEESVINRYDVEQDYQNESMKSTTKGIPSKTQKQYSTEGISFWADFNQMEPYIRDVHFFYKLDYFQYTVKLSERFVNKQTSDQKSETKKSSKKDSKKSSPSRTTFKEPEFIDIYSWPQKLLKTRNEPLYILIDSLEEKFFLVDFSTCQIDLNSPEQNSNQNSITMQKGGTDYLIIEKHNWFRRPEKSDCLLSILTAGSKSVVIELGPGRHLLKMYCRSQTNCFITISSDTIFHIGDKRKMYQLMSNESDMIEQVIRHVSNCIGNAYQSFGTENYSEALKIYYKSYLPPVEDIESKNKLFYDQIHDYFLEEKVQLLRKTLSEEEVPDVLRALRIFFLNPTIGFERFNKISKLFESLQDIENNGNSSSNENFEEDRAAASIQSFFKMMIIKKYKRIHDPQHQEHQKVLENLLKVVELFNYNRRESLANQLLRNILKHHDKLYDIYPFAKDCEQVLQVQEIKGTLSNVKPNQWLPVIRLTINCRPTETVLAGIDIFVDLPKYSVRAYNNETGHEMLRVVNNVLSTRYHYSKLGYTIVCYGWSEELSIKELPWTLNIITIKEQPVFYSMDTVIPLSLTTVPPLLMVEEFYNNYVPNSQNYISKLIVRSTKPSIVSFRLETSYENVRIKFIVMDEDENVVARVTSTSVVILPMVYLGLDRNQIQNENGNNVDKVENGYDIEESSASENESKESLNYRTYRVQAIVLDNSWPLTISEWIVVTKVREGSLVNSIRSKMGSVSHLSRTSKPDIWKIRKGSKQSIDNQIMEPPFWKLQVVTDVDNGLQVSEDRTKEEEIARMKEAWAKENPDSLARGKELREAFLKKHEIKYRHRTASLRRKSSVSGKTMRSFRAFTIDSSKISTTDSETRTLTLPSTLRKLSPLNLSLYEVREDEEDRPWIKTEADEETLTRGRLMNIIYAEEDHMHFVEEMQELLKMHRERYRDFFNEYRESFWELRLLMEDTYEMRQSYVNSIKPVPGSISKKSSSRKSKSVKT